MDPHFVTVHREAASEQGFIGCDYLINVWVFFFIVVLMVHVLLEGSELGPQYYMASCTN